jgi:hypothetical protein
MIHVLATVFAFQGADSIDIHAQGIKNQSGLVHAIQKTDIRITRPGIAAFFTRKKTATRVWLAESHVSPQAFIIRAIKFIIQR